MKNTVGSHKETQEVSNKKIETTISHDFSSTGKDITLTKIIEGNAGVENVYINYDAEDKTLSINTLSLSAEMTQILFNLLAKL